MRLSPEDLHYGTPMSRQRYRIAGIPRVTAVSVQARTLLGRQAVRVFFDFEMHAIH